MEKQYHQILLIEDDSLDAKLFNNAIKKIKEPIKLTLCTSAETAFDVLQEKNFDCIFLDYGLPGENGFQFLEKIRNINITTPLVVITSHGDEKVAATMLTNGAFDYLSKYEISPERIQKSLLSALKITETTNLKKQIEDELIDKTNRLNAILESNQNIIFAVDRHLKISTFNQSFKQAVEHITQNYNKVEKDISFHDLGLDINIQNHWLTNINKALQDEVISVEEKISFSKKRPDSWYESNFNPIRDKNNKITGVAIFTVDITEKKMAANDLLIAKNNALNAAKVKSEFLSNMSHEIRTPMNAILGLSECLLKENLEQKSVDYVNSIKYSAENLLNIINDILDFSKIENGKIKLENIDFDIYRCFNEIKATFLHKVENKGLYLNLHIEDKVPKIVNGDPYRLNQILYNLIGNALKFTEKGGIDINLKTNPKYKNRNCLIIEIIDTGIGISKENQKRIFESFTQAGPDTTRKYGGTGLGLTITKSLVEIQNGEIELESELNVGSTFRLYLDFDRSNQIKFNQNLQKADNNPDLSNYKILLVEDNKMNQFVTTQIFKHWNNNISIVNNGKEAIYLLSENNDYDLILMDLQMPEMDGYETSMFIRNQPEIIKNNHIPILALTADAFEETKTNALNAGMNDFITKPFKIDMLLNKVSKFLNNKN
ncbi:MAG: response regulator [Bacteroidia bacterium]